jgi:hypothetical protein
LITSQIFISEYIQPLIDQMPQVSSSVVSFSKSIFLGLLNGNWEYFTEAEQYAAQLAISIYE